MKTITSQQESRIVLRTEPAFKARVEEAAEVRDGGNVSRMVRRAIERLIAEERLANQVDKERVA